MNLFEMEVSYIARRNARKKFNEILKELNKHCTIVENHYTLQQAKREVKK